MTNYSAKVHFVFFMNTIGSSLIRIMLNVLTRGTPSLKDIGPGSFHQKGPNFISSPRERWPVTRSFVPVEIPDDTARSKHKDFFAALRVLGVSHLTILIPNTRVAYLYMNLTHQSESGLSNTAVEHHRSAVGTLARSRTERRRGLRHSRWVCSGRNS